LQEMLIQPIATSSTGCSTVDDPSFYLMDHDIAETCLNNPTLFRARVVHCWQESMHTERNASSTSQVESATNLINKTTAKRGRSLSSAEEPSSPFPGSSLAFGHEHGLLLSPGSRKRARRVVLQQRTIIEPTAAGTETDDGNVDEGSNRDELEEFNRAKGGNKRGIHGTPNRRQIKHVRRLANHGGPASGANIGEPALNAFKLTLSTPTNMLVPLPSKTNRQTVSTFKNNAGGAGDVDGISGMGSLENVPKKKRSRGH
jgi:hypothetical protein